MSGLAVVGDLSRIARGWVVRWAGVERSQFWAAKWRVYSVSEGENGGWKAEIDQCRVKRSELAPVLSHILGRRLFPYLNR